MMADDLEPFCEGAHTFRLPLGGRVRDRLSGYVGTIIAREQRLFTADCYTVIGDELCNDKEVEASFYDGGLELHESPERGLVGYRA